jgi:hypothetical protein
MRREGRTPLCSMPLAAAAAAAVGAPRSFGERPGRRRKRQNRATQRARGCCLRGSLFTLTAAARTLWLWQTSSWLASPNQVGGVGQTCWSNLGPLAPD